MLTDPELEEVIHHALGNLSGEQIKADGGSSAPAIMRAIREAEERAQAKLEAELDLKVVTDLRAERRKNAKLEAEIAELRGEGS